MRFRSDGSPTFFVRRQRFGVLQVLALVLVADYSVFERGWEIRERVGSGRSRVVRRVGNSREAAAICRRLNAEHEQWPAD